MSEETRTPEEIKAQLEKQEEDNKKASAERIKDEVVTPAQWFRAVQRHEDVSQTCMWIVNKEKWYENYGKQFIKFHDANGNEILKSLKEWKEQNQATSVTDPPTHDIMRIMTEQVLVLPNGKVVTPIRQYCETKILPRGTTEAFFFDFGSVRLDSIMEGTTPTYSPTIRSSSVKTEPRGTKITIGYQQTEESPIDIIASADRSFALESINDETKQVMNAVNSLKLYDETKQEGNWAERFLYNTRQGFLNILNKKKRPWRRAEDRWVNHKGNVIKDDSKITPDDKLTIKSILRAKEIIQDEGLDDSNLILYTSGKAIRDLLFDNDILKYLGRCYPEIITEHTLERILGINLVRSSAVCDTATRRVKKPENFAQKIVRVFWGRRREYIDINGKGKRSVLFIPNVAFGLVSGRDLTMEAQRRNELQAIHITGTQKIAGVVKNKEAVVRISHG